MQSANFVRAHWIWRHIVYPGGKVPSDEGGDPIEAQSIHNGKAGRPSDEDTPPSSVRQPMMFDSPSAAISRANAA